MEKMTGTVIPLSAITTSDSVGCGEYPDLEKFADFCKKANLQIIQLLPINDTGTSSSPYNALTAFALQPLYISIKNLPETKNTKVWQKDFINLADKHATNKRFNYTSLRQDKLALLHKIYNSQIEQIKNDESLSKFIDSNKHWLPYYCVYMNLKEKNNQASWKEWKTDKNLEKSAILKHWENPHLRDKQLFFAWVQLRAHEQFLQAAKYVKEQGILLKGDIPILMNEDSVDAWAYPEYFNTTLRAGAPVDSMNPEGQNWGFPTYNWQNLAHDNYEWWIDRLNQASKYYDIYRIDHVLGFFRIWTVMEGECSALNGWPQPYKGISRNQLREIGFNDEKIKWLSKPHVPTNVIETVNNNDYLATHGELQKIMNRIGNEELWLFQDSIHCDQDIWDRNDIPLPIRQKLVEYWRNRTLVEPEKNIFYPQWTYKNTIAWNSLSWDEQQTLESVIKKNEIEQEKMWSNQAHTLLGILKQNTKMITCAEDLGAMPECVPSVLKELGILGLRVIRWNRKWKEQNQPFYDFAEYPTLSVATTSVHDSSTLRLWWSSEKGASDFYRQFPPSSIIDFDSKDTIQPGTYNPKTAYYLLTAIAKAHSLFCIHPIQDFLALVAAYTDKDPKAECINIPGSVSDFNWTYRLPTTTEKLIQDTALCSTIAKISKEHQTS
jgi:4-alpha-glucanotransferase